MVSAVPVGAVGENFLNLTCIFKAIFSFLKSKLLKNAYFLEIFNEILPIYHFYHFRRKIPSRAEGARKNFGIFDEKDKNFVDFLSKFTRI